MKRSVLLAAVAAVVSAAPASADPIAPGQTLAGVAVSGQTSVYGIFGHSGSPGGFDSQPAVLTTFAAASGNVFTFSAGGGINCCGLGGAPNVPPDGGVSNMSVGGANGLSSLSGNSNIPLVGVFTTDVDPFAMAAPAALGFDATNPALSLSPLLHQVFYIGDGRSGFNNAAGATLQFNAPSNATRLYLGTIDALGFAAQTGWYHDNPGAFSVDISLARSGSGPIPEPATWAMMIGGFGIAGAAMRRRTKPRFA